MMRVIGFKQFILWLLTAPLIWLLQKLGLWDEE